MKMAQHQGAEGNGPHPEARTNGPDKCEAHATFPYPTTCNKTKPNQSLTFDQLTDGRDSLYVFGYSLRLLRPKIVILFLDEAW